MRSHHRTAAWLALLAALIAPATAGANHGFEQASFTRPVVAAEPATLVIGRCTHFALPACGCWYWSSLLVVDWGDGESDSEYRNSGKPRADTDRPAGGEFEIQHTYGAPGTYWVRIAFDGGCTAIPPCEHTGGRCVQWLKADVQPSPSAPLGAWVGIFLDAQASTCGGRRRRRPGSTSSAASRETAQSRPDGCRSANHLEPGQEPLPGHHELRRVTQVSVSGTPEPDGAVATMERWPWRTCAFAPATAVNIVVTCNALHPLSIPWVTSARGAGSPPPKLDSR